MKTEVSFTHKLSIDEVLSALKDYITENNGVIGGGQITITPQFIEQPDFIQYPKIGPILCGLNVTISEPTK